MNQPKFIYQVLDLIQEEAIDETKIYNDLSEEDTCV